jgi:soluble lytic murein transglycosylase
MGILDFKRRSLGLCLALSAASVLAAGPALASPKHKTIPVPQARPAAHPGAKAARLPVVRNLPLPRKRPQNGQTGMSAFAQANVGLHGALFASRATFKRMVRPVSGPFAIAPTIATSDADVAAVKTVIAAARKGRDADANAAEQTISDPVARKLAEWVILRSDNTNPSFERYAAFVRDNPDWPHVPLFRRRAENALWNDGIDDARVFAFFAHHQPTTAKGRYVLARVLLARGDRVGATKLVQHAWRWQDASSAVEDKVLSLFGSLLTPEDHRVRMQERLYEDDTEAGLRAAKRLGGDELAIAQARIAVIKRLKNAESFLNAVPAAARHDPGYIFARVQWLRQNKKTEEAGKLILSAPHDDASVIDPDQWWVMRRVLVRDLLDDGKAELAYRVARDSATPQQDNWRVDKHFTAGWIALRFLHNPKAAAAHFSHIAEGTDNPTALGRAGYWQGRAAEAMGKRDQAIAFYKTAAKYTLTYYGQLARARLGLKDLGLKGPPDLTPQERSVLKRLEIVRAAEILYTLNERNMLASIYAELGQSGSDVAGMSMLAELAGKYKDGRAMLLIGKSAHGRGLPMDYYAYPTVGLPNYKPIAPDIGWALAYAISRQESYFNQQVVSSAHAMGLMQVTPEAARDTARRFKVKYDQKRLLSDPVYNMQMGAGELANLLRYYKCYLLVYAGYNAGMGRVKQWIAAYGDPRDPNVDPVDWAERIPIAETRNYVQRLMENMQVYRARFGGSSKLVIEADLRHQASTPNSP